MVFFVTFFERLNNFVVLKTPVVEKWLILMKRLMAALLVMPDRRAAQEKILLA